MHLLDKYNIPAPRYTSYPTVPYWQEEPPTETQWKAHVLKAFEKNRELSLYIHLPYCESLCTYCGCNKRITRNHAVEEPYIESVLKEWRMYLDFLPDRPVIRELHLGGGTPTFFSPQHLRQLIEGITADSEVPSDAAFSFEAHPGPTSREHLETLYELGFRRISIGIQDFAPEILEIINRKQTFADVQQCTDWARDIGYTSVNYDLIFGLPLQTPDHIRTTVAKVEQLRPERIAFYSYAHVPWIKPSQRAYSEADLPLGEEKRKLYELGRELLEAAGYAEIGLDHFALPEDELFQAQNDGSLHRNFMGYTPTFTPLCLALGVSSIADSWTAFVQNEKTIEAYRERVDKGELPIIKGHILTEEDQVLRQHILNLMCRYETNWHHPDTQCEGLNDGLDRIDEFIRDGLLQQHPFSIRVTEAGKTFVRNIAMAFDARYWAKKPEGQLFSQVV